MDTIISSTNTKIQKHLIEQGVGETEDIISNLPDSLLLYILSFLSIKDVLRTSALSTRWKYLWTSISEVDFDVTRYNLGSGMKTSFLNSLEKVVLLHDPSCIRKFHLRLNMSVSALRVNSWVSAALSHKIQELDLYLPAKTFLTLPDCLFTSKSLNILKLKMDLLKVPSFIYFSNLKTLHLSVTFQGNQSAEQLFSGCPVLQELVLFNCVWENTWRITISIPSLRSLSICGPFSLNYYPDYVIAINAENLLSLECINYLKIELLPCNLPSLTTAYIDWGIHTITQRAVKLLCGIHNVESLTLSNDTLEYLSLKENLHACLPTFHSLTHFKVVFGEIDFVSEQVLVCFLQKSPNLQSLEIPEVLHLDNDWLLQIVPQCFKSCLKTVKISYSQGDVAQILFVKYLLENANVLERVTIFCLDSGIDFLKQEINHLLQATQTGSTSCVIEFCKPGSEEPDISHDLHAVKLV